MYTLLMHCLLHCFLQWFFWKVQFEAGRNTQSNITLRSRIETGKPLFLQKTHTSPPCVFPFTGQCVWKISHQGRAVEWVLVFIFLLHLSKCYIDLLVCVNQIMNQLVMECIVSWCHVIHCFLVFFMTNHHAESVSQSEYVELYPKHLLFLVSICISSAASLPEWHVSGWLFSVVAIYW